MSKTIIQLLTDCCFPKQSTIFILIVCCKTSEGWADLKGPLIFKLFHSH